ncbi:hypothetical protein AB0E82_39545 [Streptomyces anulatus]|uniref:hypothetical protein n=1 Tax=Streptomyces anulatus TaxID=1892 RepID=UPI0033CE8E3E
MSTVQTCVLAANARSLAAALAPSAEHVAPALTCFELNEMLGLLAAVGDQAAAARWIDAHNGLECSGHTVPDIAAPATEPKTDLFDEHGRFSPAPGAEYPFSVADISYAVARVLGGDWVADPGYWGTTGSLYGPYIASFTVRVDEEGDLCLTFDRMTDDAWPEDPALPEGFYPCDGGVFLDGCCSADNVEYLAEQFAAAVRAITGH